MEYYGTPKPSVPRADTHLIKKGLAPMMWGPHAKRERWRDVN